MSQGKLVLGTKRYSSWSLRGWLCVRLAGLDVTEEVIPLGQEETSLRIQSLSPSGKVPYLEHNGIQTWDSLAIAEYCAEHSAFIWPSDPHARAFARSISAEMHAGFMHLRQALPMNLGRINRPRATLLSADVAQDIIRITAIWSQARKRFGDGSPWLCGNNFGAVDAMYAPIVTRFLSYGVHLPDDARAYVEAVRAHPLISEWYDDAAAEPAAWLASRYEDID
ncbi:MAG: glutathione S-transferase family protein [Acetobacter sp.]|jgi:glutathione S-transferase|nr:glutathione S-transferase family protein [Acetobacter sp.]